MPPLVALPRTAVHAWLPSHPDHALTRTHTPPLLATGSVSPDPLDDPAAASHALELFAPFSSNPTEPLARIPTNARFTRLAWGPWDNGSAEGTLAAAFDDGSLSLYDPRSLADAEPTPLLHQLASPHRSPVRGLDFSPAQKNLLASGAANGEIFIWDLTSPSSPFSPGSRSRSLDCVTSLAWNPSVVHILASSSNSGMTVVWDLKSKREITALSWTGPGATGLGPGGFGVGGGAFGAPAMGSAMGAGGGHSVVRWHPENPTKLVTASEDDHAPFLLVWDLRNWKEPERVLRGHDKGILSMSFCPSDPDLLLSSAKDGRTIAWSLAAGTPVAEVTPAPAGSWTFDASFCPANPSFVATSSLDGTIGVHNLQSTNAPAPEDDPATAQRGSSGSGADAVADAGSFFESAIAANARHAPALSLAVEPRWLRRPATASFAFGGRLVRVSAADGVRIDRVQTVPAVVERAEALARAASGQDGPEAGGLARFCDERAAQAEAEGAGAGAWDLVRALFHAAPGPEGRRDALIELVAAGSGDGEQAGVVVDRDAVRERAQALVRELRGDDDRDEVKGEVKQEEEDEDGRAGGLFGGEGAAGAAAEDAFVASLGAGAPSAAAPSAPGDAAAEDQDLVDVPSPFSLHAPSESETDAVLTRALVVGDFASAVSLALALDRNADALLLALQSGDPALVAQAQNAHFAKNAEKVPYLRVLRALGTRTSGGGSDPGPLRGLVRDVDTADWREVLALVLTYAAPSDVPALVAQLGVRLEARFDETQDEQWRAHAAVAYAAAGALGRLTALWGAQAREREHAALVVRDDAADNDEAENPAASSSSAGRVFEARAEALQGLIEKVLAFEHATGATAGAGDGDGDDRAALYTAYLEYAELLAGQGRADLARDYVTRVPDAVEPVRRERVLRAAGVGPSQHQHPHQHPRHQQAQAQAHGRGGAYGYQPQQRVAAVHSAYNPYAPPASHPAPPQPAAYNPYAPAPPAHVASTAASPPAAATARNPYAAHAQTTNPIDDPYAPNPYAAKPASHAAAVSSQAPAPYDPYAPNPGAGFPAPPPIRSESPSFARPPTSTAAPPPPRTKPDHGWNDAPVLPPSTLLRRHTPAPPGAAGAAPPHAHALPPIASPFPNSSPAGTPGLGYGGGAGGNSVPPPPPSRGANRTPAPPPPMASGPKFAAPPPPPPTGSAPRPPPARVLSPPSSQAQAQAHNPYAPPPPPPAQGLGASINGFAPAAASLPHPPPVQQSAPPAPPPPRAAGPVYAAPPPPRAPGALPPPRPASAGGSRLPPPPQPLQPAPPMPIPAPPPARVQQQPHGAGMFVPPPPPPPTSSSSQGPPADTHAHAQGPGQGQSQGQGQGQGGQQRPPPPPQQQQHQHQPQGPGAAALKSPQLGTQPPPPLRSPQLGPNGLGAAPPPPPPPPPGQGAGQQRPPAAAPAPPVANGAPRPPQPQPQGPPRAEPPKMKYPPGDRSHIPARLQPIVDILTRELDHLRQVVPPQQGKLVAETEKRLNLLFDMVNNETLSPSSAQRVLEICQAIAARDQPKALDLHFALITAAPPAPDVAPFQAALKLLVQRMQQPTQ